MAKKRKISIRKIIQVTLTVIVTMCCIIAMVSASRIEDKKMLKDIAIHFKNERKYHFIEEKEVLKLAIGKMTTDVLQTPLSRLDIHTMEQLIMADPWVANSQVFVDNARVLHMYVTQRIPVVRVFQQNGASYYLDTTMSIMPLSTNYIYYTNVFTNVPELKNDSTGWALRKDIVSMAKTISADSFWSAQVSQVIVDSAGMYELVPILGDHRILLGSAIGLREKLDNLFVFYKNVLNRIGWDKYQTLDVRFGGQVVAAPSLPYSGPVDKAVNNSANNMNWINSIVETEARNDSKDSVLAVNTPQPENKKEVVKKVAAPAKPAAHTVAGKAAAPKKPVAHGHVVKATPGKHTKILSAKERKLRAQAKSGKKKPVKVKYVYPDKKKGH